MHHEQLLSEIGRAARGQLRARFTAADISNLAWAVATVRADGRCASGFPDGEALLGEALAALEVRLTASSSDLDRLSQRDAAQLVWAFGVERMLRPSRLTTRLLGAVIASADDDPAAPPQQVALLRIDVRRVEDGGVPVGT
jgi:hypothetical protein